MTEYYYSKLNTKAQMFYRKLVSYFNNGEASVKAPLFMSTEDVADIVKAVSYDHPELFYVDFRHLSFLKIPAGIVYQARYRIPSSMRPSIIANIEKKLTSVIDSLNALEMRSELEKFRAIHNYLVKNTNYNFAAARNPDSYPSAYSIEGVLLERQAVCEGISKAFKLICDRLSINALIAYGVSSLDGIGADMPHAWNIVEINGEYSHIDVTWDIGVSEPCKRTRYDYFCISDDWLKADHEFEGYPECSTNEYTYFRQCNRIIDSPAKLQKLIEYELKNGSKEFYFKIIGSRNDNGSMLNRVDEVVSNTLSRNLGSFSYQMAPNLNQQCYYIRVSSK